MHKIDNLKDYNMQKNTNAVLQDISDFSGLQLCGLWLPNKNNKGDIFHFPRQHWPVNFNQPTTKVNDFKLSALSLKDLNCVCM